MATKTEDPEVRIQEGDGIDELAETLRKLQKADEVDQAMLDKLTALFENLSDSAKKAFMDMPIVQSISERLITAPDLEAPPGSYIKRGPFQMKVPWRPTDLDQFPKVEFYSNEREQVIWNGIPFVFEADKTYQIPQPVYEVILHKREAIREQRELERRGFNNGVRFLQTGWAGKQAVDAQHNAVNRGE